MNEVKKCPKCGGEMEKGRDLRGYGFITLRKIGDWYGDKVIPLYCTNCGFIELYNEKYIKKE
jgi:predicted nucleic-acid-binding Zn-ribbon protein